MENKHFCISKTKIDYLHWNCHNSVWSLAGVPTIFFSLFRVVALSHRGYFRISIERVNRDNMMRSHSCACVSCPSLLLYLFVRISHSHSHFILFAPTSDEHTFPLYVCACVYANRTPSPHRTEFVHFISFLSFSLYLSLSLFLSFAPFHSMVRELDIFYVCVSIGIWSVRRHSNTSILLLRVYLYASLFYEVAWCEVQNRREFICMWIRWMRLKTRTQTHILRSSAYESGKRRQKKPKHP